MATLESQLQTLYRDRNYRERLLDIDMKRQKYQSKNVFFRRIRPFLLYVYLNFELIVIALLVFLLSLPYVFFVTLAIAIVARIVYSMSRRWQQTKSKITSFLEFLKLFAIYFPLEEIEEFIQNNFRYLSPKAKGLMMMLFYVIIVFSFPLFFIVFTLFKENIIASIFLGIVSVIAGYFTFKFFQSLKSEVQSLFELYSSALLEFQAEALTSFAQIVYPNALDVQFIPKWDFKISNKDSLGMTNSQLFYGQCDRYAECNQLTFSIDGLTYKVGDVEMIFFIDPSHHSTEFDKFTYFNKERSPSFGVFRGIFYSLPLLKAQRSSIYLIPKRTNTIPLKKRQKLVKSWGGEPRVVTVQVSRDYPWLEFDSRADRRRPDRFLREGLEEYSMESDAIEDRFYTFGKEENATRKLLSYRFMERIVEVVAPQQNENSSASKGGLFSVFQKNGDNSGCDLWFAMQPKQLSIARQRHDLMFFTETGDRSAEFENVLDNFRKLQYLLQPIEQLDLVRSNAQKL